MKITDILIITHDQFGESAINAVRMIAGHYGHLYAIGLCEGQDPAEFGSKIDEVLATFDHPEQVLVLVDFFGGTPANQILRLLTDYPVKAISGFNLPLVLDAYVRLSCGSLEPGLFSEMIDQAKGSITDLNQLHAAFKTMQAESTDF